MRASMLRRDLTSLWFQHQKLVKIFNSAILKRFFVFNVYALSLSTIILLILKGEKNIDY